MINKLHKSFGRTLLLAIAMIAYLGSTASVKADYCDPSNPDLDGTWYVYDYDYHFIKISHVNIFPKGEEGNLSEYVLNDDICYGASNNWLRYDLRTDNGVDEPELEIGKTYTVQFYTGFSYYFQYYYYATYYNYHARSYFDANQDEVFDQDDENEYLYESCFRLLCSGIYPYPYDGDCSDESRPSPFNGQFLYYMNFNNCTYTYNGYQSPNPGLTAWRDHEYDITLDCDSQQPGESRIRIMAEYYDCAVDDPCLMGSIRDYGWAKYAYIYYGHAVDYDVELVGTEVETFPANQSGLFAGEYYDGTRRIPNADGFNDSTDFEMLSVAFPSAPEAGTLMEYEIFGPLPSRTVVYRGQNSNGGDRIEIGPENVSTNADLSYDENGFVKWTSTYPGDYDDADGQWVSNDQGIPFANGEFNAARAGEYIVEMRFYNADGSQSDCGGEKFASFTIRAPDDMTASSIYRPRKNSAPDYTKYPQGASVTVIGNYKNIGLNDVKNFTAKYEVFGLTGDAEDIYLDEEFTYDWNNQQTRVLEPGDLQEIAFPQALRLPAIGTYGVRISVVDIDGLDDKDDEPFNNYFPRPTGGTKNTEWEFNDADYLIEVAYDVDLMADKVLFPIPTDDVETREDEVVANRPFTPSVQFRNLGINDAAADEANDIRVDYKIIRTSPAPEEEVVVNYVLIEDVPAGRYNIAKVNLRNVSLPEGSYRIEAEISFDPEEFDARGNNDISMEFDVLPGMQGEYTVGTLYEGEDRNFTTIREAMDAVYYLGINGDITFELTDANYDLGGTEAAWNMSTYIVGLGYNEETEEINTMTWKAADNRAVIRGGVKISMSSIGGYGVKFGQDLENADNPNAPVNTYGEYEYMDSPGYITFDGGDLNSLHFEMNSATDFAAPFYLGQGSHHITLKNLIITSAKSELDQARVHLPRKRGDDISNQIEFDENEDITRDGNNNIISNYTYTAGIASRVNFYNDDELAGVGFNRDDLNIEANHNNTFEGNEISGFGYGIVSFGYGALFVTDDAEFQMFNNNNNTYKDNKIYNVGRAGIALGNESNSTITGNMIYNVNTEYPNDEDTAGDMYDHAGIMIGGLLFELDNNDDKVKGYHADHITINGNRISNVQSSVFATGIKIEQNTNQYGVLEDTKIRVPLVDAEEMIITNNIVKDIKVTDAGAGKAGIHVFTEREDFDGGDLTTQSQDYPEYRTRGDQIINNTILMNANDGGNASAFVAGIGLQQTSGTEFYNNIIAITDENISNSHDFASLVFVQGELPQDGGPQSDNNAFHIADNSGAVLVRLVEMDPDNHTIKYLNSRNDYVNLEQWRVWTGNDKSSLEEDFLNDLDISANSISIKMENGKYPLGSVLNNRGRRIKSINGDAFGNDRGVTGQRYDIGAEEFKGELYTSDLNQVRVDAPASYRSVVPGPEYDFTGADHIMTTAPIAINTRVRNEGSLQQSGIEMHLDVYRESPSGTWTLVEELTQTATIPSTEEVVVNFYGDDSGFMPETYAELSGMGYDVPERYTGMEANVTPRYRIMISNEADENNYNNESSKEVRFFLRKSELDILLSGDYNSEALNSTDDMKFAGTLNMINLRNGLAGLGWNLNPSNGQQDYDVFDRSGWEPRAVNYSEYRTMIWSDAGVNNTGDDERDELTQYQIDNVEDFLSTNDTDLKKNLIIASQGLIEVAGDEFNKMYLRAEDQGNPIGAGEYLNQADNTVKGINVAQDFDITIYDPTLSLDDADRYPYVRAMKVYNEEGDGVAEPAFVYNTTDAFHEKRNTAGVATATQAYNTLYFGIEWRHFQEIDIVLKGVLDYLNTNDGSIVPVELASFNARQLGNKVRLDWETKSEYNSAKFVVEKANVNNNGNFGNFTAIEEVKAAGTSSEAKFYGPVDDSEVAFGNTYAYRLKSVDLDGTYEYSAVKTVTLGGLEGSLSVSTVAPNPTLDGIVNMQVVLTSDMNVTVEVYDLTGNLVSTIANNEMFVAGSHTVNVDLSNFTSGMYNVVVRADESQIVEQIRFAK